MNNFVVHVIVGLPLLGLAAGCGGSSEANVMESVVTHSVDGSKYLLSEEPEGAMGVIAARESAEDGKPLVLVGRVGGATNPWVEGRAAFMLLDPSLTVVAEGEPLGEGEICMAECCATERVASTALVKVVDAERKLVPIDARQLLGLQESDLVVVQGYAQKTGDTSFVLLANGVYIRR